MTERLQTFKPTMKRTAGAAAEVSVNVRQLVLGTAGHIDHGKTTLLRALTGIDCDRLPEEQRRGLTIDIGFAFLDLGSAKFEIIDVPGHERFIRNMLSGAVGIDLALLVIAADDSVMPQTREHLHILRLLGIRHGVIALTKTDRVEPEWLELVEDDVRRLVEGTFLEDAPLVRTAISRDSPPVGLEQLRAALQAVAENVDVDQRADVFRLPIDRAFSVAGRGTVVTGTVWSGKLEVDQPLEWLPSQRIVTARALEHHGQSADSVRCRQRAAVNLGGVHHEQIQRGHELATPGYLRPSRLLTVELEVLADSPRPIKHRSTQRLHIGTQEVMVQVELLGGASLESGTSGLAQLRCASDTLAVCGQPLVIREPSPMATIAGGRVLQPAASPLHRRQLGRIAKVRELQSSEPLRRADAAIYFFAAKPWSDLDLCRDAGLSLQRATAAIAELQAAGRLVELSSGTRAARWIHIDVCSELEQKVLRCVERLHAAEPLAPSFQRPQVVQAVGSAAEPVTMEAVVERLLGSGALVDVRGAIAHGKLKPRLPDELVLLHEKLLAELASAELRPATAAELATALGCTERQVRTLLEHGLAEGSLVHIGDGLHLLHSGEQAMRALVREQWSGSPGFTVSQLREQLGLSRKLALPLCAYLDRIGLTRRDGDLRRVIC